MWMMLQGLHFDHIDPIMVIIVVAGLIGSWYLQRDTIKWQTKWITTHDKECREHKIETNKILARLTTLGESMNARLTRAEEAIDEDIDRQLRSRKT